MLLRDHYAAQNSCDDLPSYPSDNLTITLMLSIGAEGQTCSTPLVNEQHTTLRSINISHSLSEYIRYSHSDKQRPSHAAIIYIH